LALKVTLHWKNKIHELQFGSKITPKLINSFHCPTTFGDESSLMMKKKRPELHLGSHSFGRRQRILGVKSSLVMVKRQKKSCSAQNQTHATTSFWVF
jgi:hypothetical protein